MIKDMEVECKTKFSMDVEFSFSFKEYRIDDDITVEDMSAKWYNIHSDK